MVTKGSQIKALQIVHRALLLGVLLFGIISIYIRHLRKLQGVSSSTDKILQVAVLLVAALAIWIGFSIFNKRISNMAFGLSVQEKMKVYLAAALTRWALIEAPAFFAMVGFLITGNFAFFALGLTILLVLGMVGPSKINIAHQLQLTEKEMTEL